MDGYEGCRARCLPPTLCGAGERTDETRKQKEEGSRRQAVPSAVIIHGPTETSNGLVMPKNRTCGRRRVRKDWECTSNSQKKD